MQLCINSLAPSRISTFIYVLKQWERRVTVFRLGGGRTALLAEEPYLIIIYMLSVFIYVDSSLWSTMKLLSLVWVTFFVFLFLFILSKFSFNIVFFCIFWKLLSLYSFGKHFLPETAERPNELTLLDLHVRHSGCFSHGANLFVSMPGHTCVYVVHSPIQ